VVVFAVEAPRGDDVDPAHWLRKRRDVDLPEAVAFAPPADPDEPPHVQVARAAEASGVHPAQTATVVATPSRAAAVRDAGSVAIAAPPDPVDGRRRVVLQQSGARSVYAGLDALAGDLASALDRAGPQTVSLNPGRLRAWMDEALDAAEAGMDDGEIPIGSVLLDGSGAALGRAHNRARETGRPTAHAEMEALANATAHDRGAADLNAHRGLVLVTTLEPCVMCFGAALETGVDTIVYALEAPENGASGRCTPNRGTADAHPRMVGGIGRAESLDLLRQWTARRPGEGFAHRLLRAVTE
jgi:tRNA(Arg) A34 adenosine deaminase TadA